MMNDADARVLAAIDALLAHGQRDSIRASEIANRAGLNLDDAQESLRRLAADGRVNSAGINWDAGGGTPST